DSQTFRRMFLTVLCIGIATSGASSAFCDEAADHPSSLLSAIQVVGPLSFCGESVPMNDPEVLERLEKELMISLWDRPQVLLWLKRSRRYFPIIETVLKENDLPDDLKYLAVAESALRPHAGSPRGAMGFWQFMPETARRYGLRVDRSMDDRRSIFKSTAAAVRYLTELYEDFGGWALAAAAYNMGEEGLKAEILAQGLTEYHRLYLPLETQRYLFRILSVKLIFEAPERYGFHLGENDYYPPLSFESIDVECPEETLLTVVAQAAGTDFKRLKDLNPEIRGHYLEKGRHAILGPPGSADGFEGRFRRAFKAWVRDRQERIYVVQAGDSLSTIAEQFEVPLPALLIWNRIDISKPIHPGERLVIYRGAGEIR
ncbi:MAG: transglycosylase SLT domain-containing protein, partial [Desulfobacterales bacterium]